MSDQTNKPTKNDLLKQIENDLTKAKTDAFKAKLKDLVKKRDEAQKALNLANREIEVALDEFEAGL